MALALGDQPQLEITDIAFGGEGVARHEDFVVFVPFVALGECVEVEIIELKKRFARARLMRVVRGSPDRVSPGCSYFGQCGGCQYQHIDYAVQLRLKHKQIADLFQRIGGLDPQIIAPVVPCPQPYGYRNRIMIRSQWDKFKQGLNIGFIRADNRLVVDLDECKIAEPALNEQIRYVRAHPPPKGGLKVVLRIPPEGWEVPRDSFFQNNFFLLPQLVQEARERLCHARTRHLVDVYCGVGFFSLELADQVESYVGVELDRLAIESARRNAASRGRGNGEFVAGTAEGDFCPACWLGSRRAPRPSSSTLHARGAARRLSSFSAGCGPPRLFTSPASPPPWRGTCTSCGPRGCSTCSGSVHLTCSPKRPTLSASPISDWPERFMAIPVKKPV